MTNWNWNDDYTAAYAETDDPRVLAVIERDNYPQTPYDDGGAPSYWATPSTIYGNRPAPELVTGFNDPEALHILDRFADADERFAQHGWNLAKVMDRWLRIFHGTAISIIDTQRYRNDTPLVMLDTPAWREYVGTEGGPDREHLAGQRTELLAWLDGDVYLIGWAANDGRVDTETPVPDMDKLEDNGWRVSLECGGYYGTDYAQGSALAFEMGYPILDLMLDLAVA